MAELPRIGSIGILDLGNGRFLFEHYGMDQGESTPCFKPIGIFEYNSTQDCYEPARRNTKPPASA